MTFYVEWENENMKERLSLEPPVAELAELVGDKVLEMEQCPYPAQVCLLLTDDAGIRRYNREFRNTDKPTDVLSFPGLEFIEPSGFLEAADRMPGCFDPESGELMLGDMVISVEKAVAQAKEYGHSVKREFAFLVAHSMLHLCGYDHMGAKEAAVMEDKQRQALEALQITREMP